MKALNRHYDLVHKKKRHPSSMCGNAKCLVCHSGKVLKIPTKKMLQEKEKSHQLLVDGLGGLRTSHSCLIKQIYEKR